MPRNTKPFLGFVLFCSCLVSCSGQPLAPTGVPLPSATATVRPTLAQVSTKTPTAASPFARTTPSATTTFPPWATLGALETMECATSFERRELKEPYQRYYRDQPRYTLSTEELNGYLAVMGIKSLCIPLRLGAPFVNVDWDSQRMDATGRLLSIGFENLYHGSGWSSAYIEYVTYDFVVGSEYNIFATPDDREAVRQGTMPNMIEIGGAKGFTRFQSVVFDGTHVFKT